MGWRRQWWWECEYGKTGGRSRSRDSRRVETSALATRAESRAHIIKQNKASFLSPIARRRLGGLHCKARSPTRPSLRSSFALPLRPFPLFLFACTTSSPATEPSLQHNPTPESLRIEATRHPDRGGVGPHLHSPHTPWPPAGRRSRTSAESWTRPSQRSSSLRAVDRVKYFANGFALGRFFF